MLSRAANHRKIAGDGSAMNSLPHPTPDEIDRIAALADPELRNLRITWCYHELSQAVGGLLGLSANWCTFAAWASKQAGQTIRREDLLRAFEARFDASPEVTAAIEALKRRLAALGAKLPVRLTRGTLLEALDPRAAFARAADAVARGNKKVFEEIGREFARFIAAFHGDAHFDRAKTARFCAALRRGDPPEGQRLLAEAFTAYCEARFQVGEGRSETMLLANLCAGYHEQVRLQPEIAEALDAALADPAQAKRRLARLVLPAFYLRARQRLLRDRPGFLDGVFSRLIETVNRLIRQVITEHLMTLRLASGEALRLGRDLPGAFSPGLAQIENARLRELLGKIDPTPDSLRQSGAEDWADFRERMHFIADFFRLYQERRELFAPPFTSAQVARLEAGSRPDGPL